MAQANLVASELQSIGFETKVKKANVVKVTLTSRKVSIKEVRYGLGQLFSGIEFTLVASFNGVLVLI